MLDCHFIAVLTYGKEKHGDQSDFRLGQGAGMSVLLALFGSQAREFVAPRASYRYINFDVKGISTHHDYIVLCLTPEEKTRVGCEQSLSGNVWQGEKREVNLVR